MTDVVFSEIKDVHRIFLVFAAQRLRVVVIPRVHNDPALWPEKWDEGFLRYRSHSIPWVGRSSLFAAR
jgi:hypothetical protein